MHVHDLQTSTTVDLNPAEEPTEVSAAGDYNAISADGRYVAYRTCCPNLTKRWDHQTDTSTLVSRASGAGAEANSFWSVFNSLAPTISADGRFVAFESTATNLDPEQTNDRRRQVYVRDTQDFITSLESRGSPTYVRPVSATPLYAPLVVAYSACATPDRFHDAPLAFDSCAPGPGLTPADRRHPRRQRPGGQRSRLRAGRGRAR